MSNYDSRESRGGGGGGGYQQRQGESGRYESSGGGGGQRGPPYESPRRDEAPRHGGYSNNDPNRRDRPQDGHRSSQGGDSRGGSSQHHDSRDPRGGNPYGSSNYNQQDERRREPPREGPRDGGHGGRDDGRRDDGRRDDGRRDDVRRDDARRDDVRRDDGRGGARDGGYRNDRDGGRPRDSQYQGSGSQQPRDNYRDSRDDRDKPYNRDNRDEGRDYHNSRPQPNNDSRYDDRSYNQPRHNNGPSNDRYSQPQNNYSSSNNYRNDRYDNNSGGQGGFNGGRGGGGGGGGFNQNDNGFGNGRDTRDSGNGRDDGNYNQNRGGSYHNDNPDKYSKFSNDGGYKPAPPDAPTGPDRAPVGWVPQQRGVEELMSETADQVAECEVSADQEVEIRNSDEQNRITSWENSGLHPKVLENLRIMKYTNVRAIQAAMIPQILRGYDVIGQAETSAGKTAAFGLPIVHHILSLTDAERRRSIGMNSPFALIIAPVRELAGQIAEAMRQYAAHTDVKVCLAIGQQSRAKCVGDILMGCDILVGTCGRLMDLISRNDVSLELLKFFVLDEADRLLMDKANDPDSGHLSIILNDKRFIEHTTRQTILTSATFDDKVERIAREIMKPIPGEDSLVRIVLAKGRLSNRVQYEFLETQGKAGKQRALKDLLSADKEQPAGIPKTLIFVEQKKTCDFLATRISQDGFAAQTLHGDRSQDMRDSLINDFKKSRINLLVTTDVLSRGIDVTDLARVINYDLPNGTADQGEETFIHRSGRTGRMHKGTCVSFVDPLQENDQKLSVKLAELLKTQNLESSCPQFLKDLARENAGRNFASSSFRGGRGGNGGGGSFRPSGGGGFGGGPARGGFPSGGGAGFAARGGFPSSGGTSFAATGGFPSSGGGFPPSEPTGFGGGFTKSNDETPSVGGGFGASKAPSGFGAARAEASKQEEKQEEEEEVVEERRGFAARESDLGSSSFGGEKKAEENDEEEEDEW